MLWLYTAFMTLTGLERLIEVRVSNRNAAWSFSKGGVEYGRGHYPVMVLLHTGFLIACPLEVWFFDRPFIPWLAACMFAGALALQGLRWWCITTLGPQWNTRVIIVPNLPRVTGGPYRWISHPNYVAVVLEGFALPLMHCAWLTAVCFTLCNAWLLYVRIRCENTALRQLEAV